MWEPDQADHRSPEPQEVVAVHQVLLEAGGVQWLGRGRSLR